MVRLDSTPTAWQNALSRLRQADLAAIRRIFRGYPHPDLFVAIDVSVEADLESGKEIATFTGEDDMGSCAIAPDGQTIIAGDASSRVHFLRLVEADETMLLPGEIKIPLLFRKRQPP